MTEDQKAPGKLVTTESFDSEAMEALLESEHGHFSALVVAALQAATFGAAATQVLGEKLLERGMSQEDIEVLIQESADDPMVGEIRSHLGGTCVKAAVRQWNYEAAGLFDDEPGQRTPGLETKECGCEKCQARRKRPKPAPKVVAQGSDFIVVELPGGVPTEEES